MTKIENKDYSPIFENGENVFITLKEILLVDRTLKNESGEYVDKFYQKELNTYQTNSDLYQFSIDSLNEAKNKADIRAVKLAEANLKKNRKPAQVKTTKLRFVFDAVKKNKIKELMYQTTSNYIPGIDNERGFSNPMTGEQTALGLLFSAFGVEEEVRKALPNYLIDNQDEITILTDVLVNNWAKTTIKHVETERGFIFEKLSGFSKITTSDTEMFEESRKFYVIKKGDIAASEL